MKIEFYQPVSPFFINQKFGENKACVNSTFQVINCDGNNPPPGFHSLYGDKGHLGIDLRITRGQEVYSSREGEITFVDTNPKSGLDVRVRTVLNGDVYFHIYEHLLGYMPKVGDKVMTGQLIGWADNTGYSSGDHLHFELLKNGVPIDPLSVMSPMFAKDVLRNYNTLLYLTEQVALLADRIGDYLRQKAIRN
jgi:murein DD-endopeptidase MepM/ murein hydrolase activator NlpD